VNCNDSIRLHFGNLKHVCKTYEILSKKRDFDLIKVLLLSEYKIFSPPLAKSAYFSVPEHSLLKCCAGGKYDPVPKQSSDKFNPFLLSVSF